jgi:gliding motility-associated-like protein
MLLLKCGKMKKIFPLEFIFTSIFLLLLSGNIKATIIVSGVTGCVPFQVKFESGPNIDPSLGIFWDFKDGASSDKKDVSHIFISPGIYNVTLKNGPNVYSVNITVYGSPIIQIDSDLKEGCAPLSIKFSDKTIMPPGVNITGYFWDFGDGNGKDDINPLHTYTDIGEFNVALNIETNIPNCNITQIFSKFIKIRDKIDLSFKLDSINPECRYPALMYISNTGERDTTFKYMWDFGNGQTSNLMDPIPVSIDKDSTYIITLEVEKNAGCKAKLSIEQEILAKPMVMVSFTDNICPGKDFKISTSGNASSFFWDFGPQAVPGTSTDKMPTVRFKEAGIYTVNLEYASKTGCKGDTSIIIKILPQSAEFTFEPDSICCLPAVIKCTANVKDFASYLWNGVAGDSTYTFSIPNIPRDIYYYNNVEFVEVKLQVTDTDGCTAENVMKYKYQLLNAQFSLSDHEGVIPWTVTIKDESESVCPIVTWIIDWGDGTTMTYDEISIDSASHEYAVAGRYYINMHIINNVGCEDKYFGAWVEAHDPIEETELPECEATGSQNGVLCYKQKFSLSLSNVPPQIDALQFNLGPTIANCGEQFYLNDAIMYNNPGTYKLTATLENGGTFIELNGPEITVLGPKASIDYQIPCDNSYTVSFTNRSIDYTSVKWIIDGTEKTDEQFQFTFPGRGDYSVTLIAFNDDNICKPDTTSVLIRLRDVKAKIKTDAEWCFNTPKALISSGSEDEVSGCKMGYLWSFPTADKPNIITDKDTVETFMPPGKHRVFLTVRDVNGCQSKDSADIISYFIQAGFSEDEKRICKPIKMLFADASIHDADIDTYTWSFNKEENVSEIMHTFTEITDSVMQVTLEITDVKGCKSQITKDFLTYTPESKITIAPVLCEKAEAMFSASDFTLYNSYLEYVWTVDNEVVSSKASFSKSGFLPGNHTGRLDIKEAGTGCTNFYDFAFFVTKTPVAVIADLGDSLFCYPKTLELFSESSIIDSMDRVNYIWSFPNGKSRKKINSVETFGKGEFTIKLIAQSEYGCEDSTEVKIKLVGPEGSFIADKDTICKGDIITYTLTDPKEVREFYWDFGQGLVDNNKSPVQYLYDFYPPSGSTFASMVLYGNENNCRIIQTMPIQFFKSFPSFIPDTICGLSMDIINNSEDAVDAVWTWAGQSLQNLDSIVTIKVDKYGTYALTLTIKGSPGNCIDSLTDTVSFLEPPVIMFSDRIKGCEGDTVKLLLNAQYKYNFEPPNGLIADDTTLQIIINDAELINITATSDEGCLSKDTIQVDFEKITSDQADISVFPCVTDRINKLKVDSISTSLITWTIPGFDASQILSCIHCSQPRLLESYAGIIVATVKDTRNCTLTTYTFTLFSEEIDVPNVFSPNGDNINDLFRPVAKDSGLMDFITIDKLKVFNRWGKEVYNQGMSWDGNIEGKPAPADIYYFSIEYRIGNACTQALKGDVTLIR